MTMALIAAGCGGNARDGDSTSTTKPPSSSSSTTNETAVSEVPAVGTPWIVIQVRANDRTEVRLLDQDGTVVGAPASDVAGGEQTNPDWSPDGQQLTFGMTASDGRDDLWVVDVDGANARMLYDCADDCRYIDDAAWSRDGASIAVCIMRAVDGSDIGALATVDVATGQLTDLASFEATQFCSGARWSPDGSQIVLEVVQRSGTTMADDVTGVVLSIVDVASGNVVRALTEPGSFAATADWSASTGQIVYSALPAGGAGGPDLFAIQPDGSGLTRLTELSDDGGAAEEPSIDPDGTSVVFVGSGSVSGLTQVDLTSGAVTPAFAAPITANHPRHRP